MKYPALLLALVLTSCSAVYTTKPIGEKPKDLTHEVSDWEGVWTNADGQTCNIKVLDPVKGMLEVASVELQDNEFQLKKYTILLRESGTWCFASLRNDEVKVDRQLYLWAKISRDGRQLVAWYPDSDKFKDLINKGLLPGKIGKDDIVLGDLDPKQMEVITSGSNGVLFDWEKPSILTKSSK